MTSTTIKIDTELKGRLNALKIHPRESYSEVIERLVVMAVNKEPLSEETIREGPRTVARGSQGRESLHSG